MDTNKWRLNHRLLNNQQITEEIKKEIKIGTEKNHNENTTRLMRFNKSSTKWEVQRNTNPTSENKRNIN